MTAQARPYTVSASGAVITGPGSYRGHALREAAGSPGAAVVRIWDGTAASGVLVAAVNLAASGASHVAAPDGLRVEKGIYVEVVSGTIEGSVWVG